jgi:glycosyltransferase involved in cell wall biosynthesis
MSESSLVSVIMPAYNSALFVRQSIDSVLNQTYQNFELLIYDDCSTDNTVDIITSYKDERIKLYKKDNNTGYTNSLIKGIEDANGKYIARIDSDDVCHTERLEKQVAFLDTNADYGLVGSFLQTITGNTVSETWQYPVNDDAIRLFTIINSPFAHPSVMIRKEVLVQHQLTYSTAYEPCEDYKLWFDLLKVTKCKNLPEVLLYYRLHANQTIVLRRNRLIEISNRIRQLVLNDFYGIKLADTELMNHYAFFNEIKSNTAALIREKQQWKKKLIHCFKQTSQAEQAVKLIEAYWIVNLRTLAEFKLSFISFLNDKSVIKAFSYAETARFFVKCVTGYKVKQKGK